MECKKCISTKVVKNGRSQSGNQRYYCKSCKRSFQTSYYYESYLVPDFQIITLLKENCGIRSIGRILRITPNTVIRKILSIARTIRRPYPILKGKTYEVDELFTYIKHKKKNRVCIVYSYEPLTGYVLDIAVGRRTKNLLRKVLNTLILSEAKRIFTDKLSWYKELIPEEVHRTHRRCTNHIERQNLNLRTHLKRLNRRTICYSKSLAMLLLAVVRIYFWG